MTPQPPNPSAARSASPWAVAVLLAMVFVSLLGMGVVVPLLPFYGLLFQVEPWKVAMLFAMFSAGQFLGELFWGRLSDRIGRRPVILITVLGAAVGHAGLAFAPDIWIAIAARTFCGFFSGNVSTLQSYMVDVSPPERLAGRLGMIGSALGVGFIIGPTIGGLLAQPALGLAGFRLPLLIAAGACLLAALGGLVLLPESHKAADRATPAAGVLTALRTALGEPVLQRLLASTFIAFAGYSGAWAIIGLWGDAQFGWGPRAVGLLLAGTGVGVVLGQGLLAGPAARRLGEVGAIACGLGATAAAFVLVAVTDWAAAAGPLLVFAVAANALAQPAANLLISRAAGPDRQGAILGANAAAGALARVAGPVIAGFLFSAVGHDAPFLFAALAMLPAIWLAWRGAARLRLGT